ncbi:hypothetical protein G195_000771 [Phytophthora kernoviae 00238/432]|uniref:Elicitin-like protein n=1 Tax=Phytophthora kernoviae 00238/432 TaxID=1284355 RepID=A0A8J4WBR3_9STRA|nr:hypothetical protein G195_000771 [Phytophthora kernoviae 00238/432]
MKTAGAIVLFTSIAIAASVADDACPPSEVVKFAVLYSNPHLHPCQEVSAGFSIAPPRGYPTEPQVKAMCAADACRSLIKDVLELKPNNCYLSFGGVELNAYKLASNFEDACKHEKAPKDDDTSCNTDEDKDHEDGKYHPTPKPTDHKYPKPTEHDKDGKYHPTPKPTDHKYPKPTEHDKDDKYYPTPKPTDHKYPKPTEHDKDDKYYPTPKPTDHKYPKPTEHDKDDKYYPTPKPTDDGKNDHKQNEVKTSSSKGRESASDAEEWKPPMNGTSENYHPMPNTTYKAERLTKSLS